MKRNTIDVYFYVNNKQDPGAIDGMERALAKLAGVKKTGVNPRVNRLLAVEYDPQQISGSSLVRFVKQSGYSAAMVGM